MVDFAWISARSATPMSGGRASLRRAPRSFTAVARASLLAAAAMSTGCLITETPQFTARPHTRPMLVEATASPDPGQILLIDGTVPMQEFYADVISQDDPANISSPFEKVFSYLYLDYGIDGSSRPFRDVVQGSSLESGSLEQTKRKVSVDWYPDDSRLNDGCHTATLIVSHKFDDLPTRPPNTPPCPLCDDDFSTITWKMLVCSNGGDCNDFPLTGPSSCEGLASKRNCAAWRDVHPGTACPADAGAP
jgi:hypothetical protein